ncbi:hypothetical protein [Empedobacter brevis]|uniref:hypothetical protein n=1 Tax=Empedobacter brevis TaxID=247 RepID=UPI00333EF353
MKGTFNLKNLSQAAFCILLFIILTSSGGSSPPPWEKENVSFPMMDLEINATMKENSRQKKLKKNQDVNTSVEVYNESEWKKFKEKVVKVQDRLRIVSFAMQAIPTGVVITRDMKAIQDNQIGLMNEMTDAPLTIVVAFPSQIKFLDDLQMVIRLLTGIVVSYGAINQMEKAERAILLDYAVKEVKQLKVDSSYMLFMVREIKAKFKRNKRAFQYYVNRDRQVVENIMKNIKTF